VPLYFAAERPVVERDGSLIMVDDHRLPLRSRRAADDEKSALPYARLLSPERRIESEADTLTAIIQEMLLTTRSERQGRVIDYDGAASMEKKKQEGYF
jgi:sulfate adenylyltransferase subunit 2